LDVAEGYVSRARALDDYGVVMTADGGIDVEATKRKRASKGEEDQSCEPLATSSLLRPLPSY
jgi:hypothetical protein